MASYPALDYLRSLMRIAAREVRGRERREWKPGQRLVVERWGMEPDPRRLAAYLRVTDATRIPRLRGADALLPPLFPATWEAALAVELLCHPHAPSPRRGIVHLETELLLVRPLRARDSFRCRLELERVEPDPRGVRLQLLTRTWNAAGQLGSESRTSLLARRGSPATREGPLPAEAPPHAGEAAVAEWEEVARWALRGGEGRRYALASGDYNPIHLSRLTALPFGFRRPILHGFCTAALAAHALIERRFGSVPERLRRVRVAFRKPLLLPAEIRLLTAPRAHGTCAFRVVGAGGTPYVEGEAGGGG
jgi:acyl dehydratase